MPREDRLLMLCSDNNNDENDDKYTERTINNL